MYTLGAVHTLSGQGVETIAGPSGLKTALSGIPGFVGWNAGNPNAYFRVGRVALGNADGWLPSFELHHAAGIFFPVPPGMTKLGYDLVAGMTLVLTELTGGVPMQPYDRGATLVNLSATKNLVGGGGPWTLFTYTVPAAKWLMLSHFALSVVRVLAPTVVPPKQSLIMATIGVQQVLRLTLVDNTLLRMERALAGGPIYLPAATVLAAQLLNVDADGSITGTAEAVGLLFDA